MAAANQGKGDAPDTASHEALFSRLTAQERMRRWHLRHLTGGDFRPRTQAEQDELDALEAKLA